MIYDSNYKIEFIDSSFLDDDAKIYDIYFERTDYCFKKNEKLYLKYKLSDGNDGVICLAENNPSKYKIDFDTEQKKEKFYRNRQDDKFYNNVKIYLVLTDKQAIDLLNIFKEKINQSDYSFKYCDQDVIVRNIVRPNLDNSEVLSVYNSYGKRYDEKNLLEKMLNEGDGSLSFNSSFNKKNN